MLRTVSARVYFWSQKVKNRKRGFLGKFFKRLKRKKEERSRLEIKKEVNIEEGSGAERLGRRVTSQLENLMGEKIEKVDRVLQK